MKKFKSNPIIRIFQNLNLIKKSNIKMYQKTIRDEKINVLTDKYNEIYFLEKVLLKKNYNTGLEKYRFKTKNYISKSFDKMKFNDALRRFDYFKKKIKNKKILDFGCGYGEFLEKSKKVTKYVYGYENDISRINTLKKKGKINLVKDLSLYKNYFDYVFLFHVFEHLENPDEILKNLKRTLKKNGRIILEIPNSKDFLISLPELKEFKKFTFWTGHLILYNEKFIKKFLNKIGFKFIKVYHFQRYNFQNHLGWFLFKKPGGHNYLKKYYDKDFDNAYKEYLCKIKQSDTIIVEIKV